MATAAGCTGLKTPRPCKGLGSFLSAGFLCAHESLRAIAAGHRMRALENTPKHKLLVRFEIATFTSSERWSCMLCRHGAPHLTWRVPCRSNLYVLPAFEDPVPRQLCKTTKATLTSTQLHSHRLWTPARVSRVGTGSDLVIAQAYLSTRCYFECSLKGLPEGFRAHQRCLSSC